MTDSTAVDKTADKTANTAVSVIGNTGIARYADDQLHELKSFKDAFGILEATDSTPEDYSETYGTGFTILNDKGRLVGVPMLVIEWRFSEGSYGDGSFFASALVMTERDEKYVVNDGSSGLCAQLRTVTESRLARGASPEQARRGLLVRGGLTRSDYTTPVIDGKTGEEKMIEATTFYLAN